MKYLFYDDSPVFGGHEVMTLLGVEALLAEAGTRVDFLASRANSVLLEKLGTIAAKHPGLRVEPVSNCSSKLEALRNRAAGGRKNALAARFKELSPDLVVAVQGNIEHSSLAMLAARAAGIKVASYIPVPHSNAEMAAKLGGLRDLFTAYLFRAPDAFVTISDEMAAMLRARGVVCPIEVVYNGVDTRRFQPLDRSASREALGIPADGVLLGMVGRLEFKQKQQHLLVEAVKSSSVLKAGCRLAFVGDGPDRENLAQALKDAGLDGRATLIPWSDPSTIYPALDALVIPSRYEGLPLVMLEALACETAVLGSDRDGMRDVLPADWRFRPNDAGSLASTIARFSDQGCPAPPAALLQRVRNDMSLDAFGAAFRRCLSGLASRR